MKPRMNYYQAAPDTIKALMALEAQIQSTGLEKSLIELVKIRASQINGCAFCIQYHLNMARKLAVEAPKLDLLAAWREVGVYTARERAALAWTEALTRMDRHSVSDATYAQVQAQFTRSEIAFLTASVGAINAWNRIAGALHFEPPVA